MRIVLTLILTLLALPLFAQNSVLRQGNKAYDEGKFGQAFELYEKAAAKSPEKAVYNSGTALYRLQDYSAAAEAFSQVKESKDRNQAVLYQNALYNLGNAAYKAGDKETAKQAMRSAILYNLRDEDAKHNLQFILKEEQAQKNSQQPKDNPQQNQNNKQDQQNQNKQNQDSQQKQDQQQEQQKQEQQEKDSSAKEEAANVLQMAQEHKQDLPKADVRSNQIEKDW